MPEVRTEPSSTEATHRSANEPMRTCTVWLRPVTLSSKSTQWPFFMAKGSVSVVTPLVSRCEEIQSVVAGFVAATGAVIGVEGVVGAAVLVV